MQILQLLFSLLLINSSRANDGLLKDPMSSVLGNGLVIDAKRDRLILKEKVQSNVTWNLDRLSSPNRDRKYKYKYDGTGVTIYLFSSGIRRTHIEFGGRATCANYSVNAICRDLDGTGTAMASVAGGRRYGVAKNVAIESIRIYDSNNTFSKDLILSGVNYVLKVRTENPKKPMIVLSLGLFKTDDLGLQLVQTLTSNNITIIAGSGTNSTDACENIPQAAPSCITVAPVNRSNYRMATSNYGTCVDLLAPGQDIRVASNKTDINTAIASYSALAGAHAAGVAAMFLQKNPTWTPAQVTKALRRYALRNTIKFPNSNYTPNLLLSTDYITKN